ncbi:signal recognition particle-docking protein FtsY [Buchnera aphidicola (Melanaphis sacchari)]|uniref:Signal recognition particle receptor FtsY n=1 Tax=Buchnera aphidicola (Melanaphis sacchari) TaxID=2173854 RepID=A0A2U8DFY8_9GAMM|nr:signal recognition particle-docking protein FtsY [Buchnera aphidicola]AWH90729.1 signal recognition particle-docking protein FtsY [Buchnera aphidicola (Melanaphis sacchari)]
MSNKKSFFSWINFGKNKENQKKNLDGDKIFQENRQIVSTKKDNITTKKKFFLKLKEGLIKTKKFFGNSIDRIFLSKKIDDALFEELEETMILSDISISTTDKIIKDLINDAHRKELKDSKKVYFLLKQKMYSILKKVEVPLNVINEFPFVILVVGVNGTGKTTTISKLAKRYKLQGKSVMLAASDTFRAAGIEQLQTLGAMNNIPVIAQTLGSDPAAVAFDALKSAMSKKIDILIIDTAGRLHNKLYLVEELKKIVRVIKKLNPCAPHEKILTIDACNGQNTIKQTEKFHEALNLTGLIITKLDGTAKGGVIFTLADQFLIPIRYIGIGEKADDLIVFDSNSFIQSIFCSQK